MKKITRKGKTRIDKQLRKEKYHQGEHTVHVNDKEVIVVVVKGREAFLPSGSRLAVPEEWWV